MKKIVIQLKLQILLKNTYMTMDRIIQFRRILSTGKLQMTTRKEC